MERKCPKCGAVVGPNATQCSTCGASIAAANTPKSNIYAIAGALLALIMMLLCIITNFVDSATFLNRMYTTVIEWNIPLATIALIVVGFAISRREKQPLLINFVGVAFIIVAFIFSNVTKNKVQDHVSNFENYIDIAAEAMKDNAEEVIDWKDNLEDAAADVAAEFEAAAKAEAERNMKSMRGTRDYDDYDDYEDYDAYNEYDDYEEYEEYDYYY